ncbi:inosine guanosine and xanthosine phosphorylase family protein [Tritrichomonas foetus]|uniref:purine-nucleoside phosphorylase n=1 Tax=Tritrichomonas foetus TaxID=1144522 RepID=A0A1J4KVI5_9EUKA|nr:inosine guanosine and xanthosine phosphorylase family protein [Tritrichomonas foetus]|eukprot:OHT15321.1 inosine guanosine and xanthosine phosphorylase family protein [Tritrichomonas foetus]
MQAKVYVDRLNEACNYVKSRIGDRPDVGIILGSGLGSYGDVLIDPIKIPYKEIPRMLDTTVPGHSGCLIFGKVGDRKVLCLSGRSHQYEGLYPHEVQFSIRLLALCGCKLCILTNAAGTRDPDLNVGDLCPMTDHTNFTHRGYTEEPLSFKPFHHIIQTNMYDEAATKVAREVAVEMKLQTKGCVYCYNFGPTYESHAEVEGEFKFGATNFGMSTVPEIVAMKDLNVPVFAMSFCTNKAAGVCETPLSHEEVQIAAKNGEPNMRALISEVIKRTPLKDFPIPVIEGDDHIIARVLPKCFISDQELSSVTSQFSPSEIDAVIVLGACHTLEGFTPKTTVPCKDLPHFPALQHTSVELQIGELNGHQVFVFKGFLNLNGPEEHALYYICKLAHSLKASTYIQTFSSGSFGEHKVSLVEDVCPLFERPVKVPQLCSKPLDLNGLPSLPHCVLASYHGPEFPSCAEATGIQRAGATHVTLGTVKGPLIANAVGLRPVCIADGAYNGILTNADTLDALLASCRAASKAVSEAVLSVVGSIPKKTATTPAFTATNAKAIFYNDAVPVAQNEQEDPEKVNEIANKLPDVNFAIVFQNDASKSFNSLKAQLATVTKVNDKYTTYSGELNGKKVLLTTTSRELIRAFAQKNIKVAAVGPVLPADETLANEKFVSIQDHANLCGIVPLVGRNKFGDRFPDMGNPYVAVPGLKTACSYNVVDINEATAAYKKAMTLFNTNVACEFGVEEAIVTKHAKGKISHIGVVVKCPCQEWEVNDEVLRAALE